MLGLVLVVLVAALVYKVCEWVGIPQAIGVLLAAIIIIAGVANYIGY